MEQLNNIVGRNLADQTKDLLLASLFLPMDRIESTVVTLDTHPERVASIAKVLEEMIREEKPRFKSKIPHEDFKKVACDRIADWTKLFGPPTMKQYALLNKYWSLPLSDVFPDKITPKIINELVDCFMVGQEDYKRKLSTCFYLYLMKNDPHTADINLPKSNLLVSGPSGSGKTYGMQVLARHFNVPCIFISCNNLVPEGIIGSSISDYFTEAYLNLNETDEERAKEYLSRAIVCLDEMDKPISSYFGETIFNEILSLIDDNGKIRFGKSFSSGSKQLTIPTKKMMFVFTGFFSGLEKIRKGNPLGFQKADITHGEPKPLSSTDLIEYGLKPEIVGRIQNYTSVKLLSETELCEALESKLDSPLADYCNYFSLNGIETVFTKEAVEYVAQIAHERQLGVRGLKSILDSVFTNDMYGLPANNRLEVTREYVERHIN